MLQDPDAVKPERVNKEMLLMNKAGFADPATGVHSDDYSVAEIQCLI